MLLTHISLDRINVSRASPLRPWNSISLLIKNHKTKHWKTHKQLNKLFHMYMAYLRLTTWYCTNRAVNTTPWWRITANIQSNEYKMVKEIKSEVCDLLGRYAPEKRLRQMLQNRTIICLRIYSFSQYTVTNINDSALNIGKYKINN